MMRAAKYGLIMNYPISPRDVRLMTTILGPNISRLQGKTIRRKRKKVIDELVPIPQSVMNHYRDITLSVDIMHFNRIPFLVTISKHMHYGTANTLMKMMGEVLFDVISQLAKFYRRRGFNIAILLVDKQFKSLNNDLAGVGITLNIAGQEEHVLEIERFIRVIKERCRSAIRNTPFTKIPSGMIIGLVQCVLVYINGLPWERGVSMILSPMTIVTGKKLDYNLHCWAPYGSYVQVRQKTDNTMKTRTYGAIVLGPTHNLQGGMSFMRLKTGRKIDRDKSDYIILLMPDEVINQVNETGKDNPEGLLFGH